jgi:hypothetical protein
MNLIGDIKPAASAVPLTFSSFVLFVSFVVVLP